MKHLRLGLSRLKKKFKPPEPKLDERNPRTIFRSAMQKKSLDADELLTVLQAIDSLREKGDAHTSTIKFVVDKETLKALVQLAFTTKYESILMAANVVINNKTKE